MGDVTGALVIDGRMYPIGLICLEDGRIRLITEPVRGPFRPGRYAITVFGSDGIGVGQGDAYIDVSAADDQQVILMYNLKVEAIT